MTHTAEKDVCPGCAHGAAVHDQYGCVTCWNEMGDPCDIPPAVTDEATR